MLRDINFFEARLGKIDGFDDTAEYLTNIINSKEVQKTTAAPSTEGASAREEEKQAGENAEAPAASVNNGTGQTTEESAA